MVSLFSSSVAHQGSIKGFKQMVWVNKQGSKWGFTSKMCFFEVNGLGCSTKGYWFWTV